MTTAKVSGSTSPGEETCEGCVLAVPKEVLVITSVTLKWIMQGIS